MSSTTRISCRQATLGTEGLEVGIVADLIAANRKLMQDTLSRVRELQASGEPETDESEDEPASILARMR